MYAGGQGATGSATSELVRVSAFRISNCKTIFEEASVRFIHTSDWHLGRSFHRQDLLATQAQFLNWLLALAKKEAVGAVLVAGDVYDRSQPPADAVKLLDSTVSDFAQARIPLIITAGNHDSPVRLQYGKNLFADQGIHIRANLESVTEPVILTDDHGQVGVYGIPYLHPDLVNEELGSARSHESVLAAVAKRITADVQRRGLQRTVVLAHAFITGGETSESEMDIRVGGVDNASAGVFDGFGYVALGHLHGPQMVNLSDSATTLAYSGSPIAFSFGERDHRKSVALVEIDDLGAASVERVVVPTQRAVRQVRGNLSDLLEIGSQEPPEARDDFMKVILTDPVRPESPMERLKTVWPNALVLDFDSGVILDDGEADLLRLHGVTDPLEISGHFYEHVTGRSLDADHERVLRTAIESATRGA
jgi:exonuclease SbcD